MFLDAFTHLDNYVKEQNKENKPVSYDIFLEIVNERIDLLYENQKKANVSDGMFKILGTALKENRKWQYWLQKKVMKHAAIV